MSTVSPFAVEAGSLFERLAPRTFEVEGFRGSLVRNLHQLFTQRRDSFLQSPGLSHEEAGGGSHMISASLDTRRVAERIERAVNRYEPRVDVLAVEVRLGDNGGVTVNLSLRQRPRPQVQRASATGSCDEDVVPLRLTAKLRPNETPELEVCAEQE
jgi:hypothetical protein